MESVTGTVTSFGVTLGRADGAIHLTVALSDGHTATQFVLTEDDASNITIDGERILPKRSPFSARRCVADWLLAVAVPKVTAYPVAERYGAAVRAEFTSESK